MEIKEGKTRIMKSCPKCRERTENVVYKITKKGYSVKLRCLRCLKFSSRHYDINSIVDYEIKNYNKFVRKRNKISNKNILNDISKTKDILVTETRNNNHIVNVICLRKLSESNLNQKEVC